MLKHILLHLIPFLFAKVFVFFFRGIRYIEILLKFWHLKIAFQICLQIAQKKQTVLQTLYG